MPIKNLIPISHPQLDPLDIFKKKYCDTANVSDMCGFLTSTKKNKTKLDLTRFLIYFFCYFLRNQKKYNQIN